VKKKEFGFLPLLLALVVIFSVILLAYAYLQSSVSGREQTAQQLEHGQMADEAMTEYKNLVDFLKTWSLLRNQFEEEYSGAMIAQLRLLYQMPRILASLKEDSRRDVVKSLRLYEQYSAMIKPDKATKAVSPEVYRAKRKKALAGSGFPTF